MTKKTWVQSEFDDWYKRVNAYVIALCGMSCDCLPDWSYADAYLDGVVPRIAARRIIRAAKEFWS